MEVINDVAGPPACMDPSVLCHMYTNFASSMIWRKHQYHVASAGFEKIVNFGLIERLRG